MMRAVNTAARDPIFWLHHANIDRLWERWLQLGGGRADPVQDANWMTSSFTFFDVDANGQAVEVQLSAQDILNTVQQMDYTYDDAPSLAQNGKKVLSSSNRTARQSSPTTSANTQLEVALSGNKSSGDKVPSSSNRKERQSLPTTSANTRLEVALSGNNQEGVTVLSDAPLTLVVPFTQAQASRWLSDKKSAIFLNVEGVEFNPNNSIPYEIYINLPEGVTPNPESPYYVGKLALFAHDQGGTFNIEITDVLRELRQLNLITGNSLSVTFVPPPEEIPQQIVREGSAAQLQGAVRFKRVTLTRE